MAVMTDRQFFFVVGVALVSAVVVTYYSRKLGPSVVSALQDAGREARNTASTIANAPLQATRDVNEDGSTFGSRGWAHNLGNQVKGWFVGNDKSYTGPYDNGGKVSSFEQLPVFTPYRRDY
ncbi:hypothetical protein [Aliamphritea ceti]|uniref:hypothetical protein n=1 Tax=Aliamphritea ceti TaxID=1524258 RepID=UPI0021C437A9|nr:hypothetical protein [Aliamphritea ceti]